MEAFDIIDNPEVQGEFEQAFQEMDRLEIIQILSDLDYLPLKAFSDGVISDTERAKAVQEFRSDLKESLAKPNMSNLEEIVQASKELIAKEKPLADQLTQREVYILKEITGLDQELDIKQVFEHKTTLLSRVLIYRYRIYDLIDETILPSQELGASLTSTFQNVANELGYKNHWLPFGNLLANQHQLSDFCMTSPVLTNKIAGDCIFISVNHEAGKSFIDELGNKVKRRQRFLGSISSEESEKYIRNMTKKKNQNQLEEEVAKRFNWTSNMIIENQQNGRRALGRILYNLGNDQCIINIDYILKNYFIPMEGDTISNEQASVSQVYNYVLEDKSSEIGMKSKHVVEVQQESKKLTSTLQTELRNESQTVLDKNSPNVRQYKAKTGIAKFFSKAFKFVKNLISRLRQLFEKLFRIVKKAVKFIYSEIKEAFQTFRDGLKFLFGNRIVNPTKSITTDYDADFDGITTIHSKPTAEDIKIHTEELKKYSTAIYPTLNFIKEVIKWGIRIFAQGPIGWVKILIGIAKIFKEMLQKKQIQLATA